MIFSEVFFEVRTAEHERTKVEKRLLRESDPLRIDATETEGLVHYKY